MIGEKFELNGKQYELKNAVTFGEYQDITKVQFSMKHASDENQEELVMKFNQLMVEFLENKLGLKEEDLRKLTLLESAEVFGKAFILSTTIKKKLETTSESQSLQTTQTIQP